MSALILQIAIPDIRCHLFTAVSQVLGARIYTCFAPLGLFCHEIIASYQRAPRHEFRLCAVVTRGLCPHGNSSFFSGFGNSSMPEASPAEGTAELRANFSHRLAVVTKNMITHCQRSEHRMTRDRLPPYCLIRSHCIPPPPCIHPPSTPLPLSWPALHICS